MTLLSSLNVVQADTKTAKATGIEAKRQKLIERIGDQVSLIKAQDAGNSFSRIRYKLEKATDNETTSQVPVNTRVRPWWLQDRDGTFLVWIKYGNQVLELQKGKQSIRVKTRAELVGTFETVSKAVAAGELDPLIEAAVSGFQKRFKKG